MCHPLLPATKSPKHASRLGWKRTAFALLSAEQFDLRSLPGHWFATGRWSEPDRRAVDLPDRGFQHESAADIPQTGEVCFTSQLHLIQGDKLHRLEVANCGKSSKINAERPRSGNAAKTSDEAGATPPFAARCVTSSVGSLPPHQFSECTRRLSKSTGRSSFLNFHLSEDTVTSARRTRVTVAVTNAVTSDAWQNHARHGSYESDWTRGKPRNGLERPRFWPNAYCQKTARVAPAHCATHTTVRSDGAESNQTSLHAHINNVRMQERKTAWQFSKQHPNHRRMKHSNCGLMRRSRRSSRSTPSSLIPQNPML